MRDSKFGVRSSENLELRVALFAQISRFTPTVCGAGGLFQHPVSALAFFGMAYLVIMAERIHKTIVAPPIPCPSQGG